MTEPCLIDATGLLKVYGSGPGQVRALDGVDVRVREGELVGVIGASGSGKSTCMNILGCLDAPTAGEYRFLGLDVRALDRNALALLRRHYIGFVFQSFNLLARATATENVELPLVYKGVRRRQRRELALSTLARLGLSDRAAHRPTELSGGQQQRVALARALVTEPSLLLADEPTGNLDSATGLEIMNLLAGFNQEVGLTIIMVTHEPDIARFARRVLVFRDGCIVEDGPPEKVLS